MKLRRTATLGELDERHHERYFLFKSICEMLEASCRPEELEALRRERAELEKKLGYDKYRAEEATPLYSTSRKKQRIARANGSSGAA